MAKPSPRLQQGRSAAPSLGRAPAQEAVDASPRRSRLRPVQVVVERSLPSSTPRFRVLSIPPTDIRLQRTGDTAVLANPPEMNGHQEGRHKRQEDDVERVEPDQARL